MGSPSSHEIGEKVAMGGHRQSLQGRNCRPRSGWGHPKLGEETVSPPLEECSPTDTLTSTQ